MRCGLLQGIANFQPRHHHFDGDHGVVDQKAERDDQGAERNALQRNSGIRHHHERDRQNQGNRDRNDQTGAKAEAQEADREHDDHRFEQRFREAGHGVLDNDRLVSDEMNSQADRLLGQNLGHFLFQRLAEFQQVRARLHPDRECDGGLDR